jgi:chemotaxis protein methyltransferase CheR
MQGTKLNDNDFNRFSRMVYEFCGIKLGPGKKALVHARLASRLKTLNLIKFSDYYEYIVKDTTGLELSRMIDRITTNKTDFFREPDHFTHLAQVVIPAWLEEQKNQTPRPFRIWCAAAATGEEPYSLAMVALNALDKRCGVLVLATDISSNALLRAQEGIYEKEKTSPVPTQILQKYFVSKTIDGIKVMEAGGEIRSAIKFARFNLIAEKYPFQNPFDVIFCRNVMIYFDRITQEKLVQNSSQVLRPGGYFYTGHSESVFSLKHNLVSVSSAVYYKPKEGEVITKRSKTRETAAL